MLTKGGGDEAWERASYYLGLDRVRSVNEGGGDEVGSLNVGGARASTVKGGNGSCVATGAAIPVEYTKAEGRVGRIGAHLMAVAAAGASGRVYCEPSPADFNACREAVKCSADAWKPAGSLPP